MMTVAIPSIAPKVWNVEANAIPVTMPGRVSGSTTRKLIVDLPKNENRCTANAAIVPSISAISIAQSPANTEVATASRAP